MQILRFFSGILQRNNYLRKHKKYKLSYGYELSKYIV